MILKTAVGKRLKRLAKNYADWWAEMTWIGSRYPREHEAIKQQYRKARKKLHDAIDELTSVDYTPTSVFFQAGDLE